MVESSATWYGLYIHARWNTCKTPVSPLQGINKVSPDGTLVPLGQLNDLAISERDVQDFNDTLNG